MTVYQELPVGQSPALSKALLMTSHCALSPQAVDGPQIIGMDAAFLSRVLGSVVQWLRVLLYDRE